MPIYQIETPDGRVMEIEGDKMPPMDIIEKAYAKLPQIEQPGFIDRVSGAVQESGGVIPYVKDVAQAGKRELSDVGQLLKGLGRGALEGYVGSKSPVPTPTPTLDMVGQMALQGGKKVIQDPSIIPKAILEGGKGMLRSYTDPTQKFKEGPIEAFADLSLIGKGLKGVLKGAKAISKIPRSKLNKAIKSPETLSVEDVAGTPFEPVIKRLKSNEDIIAKINPKKLKEGAFRDQVGVKMQGTINNLTKVLVKEQQKGVTKQPVNRSKILSEFDKRVIYKGYDGIDTPPAVKAFKNRLEEKKSFTVEDLLKERKEIDRKIKYDEFGNLKDMRDEVSFELRDTLSDFLKKPSINSKYEKYASATENLRRLQGKKQKNVFKKSKDPGAGADLSKGYSSLSSTQRENIRNNIKDIEGPGLSKVKRDLDTQLRTLDAANDIFAYEQVFNEYLPAFRRGIPIESVIQTAKVKTLPLRQKLQRVSKRAGSLPVMGLTKAAVTTSGAITPQFTEELKAQRGLLPQQRRR
tara:strand:- start:2153 stop:3712 length:1560 start_codon:yes stop_codon:yes gene_type:complete